MCFGKFWTVPIMEACVGYLHIFANTKHPQYTLYLHITQKLHAHISITIQMPQKDSHWPPGYVV